MVSGFWAVTFNFNVLCSLSLILYATAIVLHVCFANCALSNPRTLEPAPLVSGLFLIDCPFPQLPSHLPNLSSVSSSGEHFSSQISLSTKSSFLRTPNLISFCCCCCYSVLFIFFNFLTLFYFLTLQYCICFAFLKSD
jgi:hypothetical protein